MMALGGPGFGEALYKNQLAQKQMEVQEMDLDLKKGELGFKLQDLQERRAAAKQQAIMVGLEKSVERMNGFAGLIQQLGPNFKAGSALDKAIDTEKGILAQYAAMAGLDQNLGQAMADRVRAAAQIPKAPVTMSPGQSLVDPSTGQAVASMAPSPVTMSPGSSLVNPANGQTIAQTAPSPVSLSPGGTLVNPSNGQTVASAPQLPQSTAGKILQDRSLFVNQYGENSPQVRAFDEMSQQGEVKLDDVSGVRKEFTAQSKDFVTVRDAFGKVAAAAKDSTAAGDLSLIFAFMKMLDPNSTVREGEFATAQNAAGIPDRVVTMYNKALSGTRLSAEQRKDFTAQAEKVFKVQLKSHLKNEENYRGIAKRNKMREEDVVIDFIGPYRSAISNGDDNDPLGIRKK